MHEQEWPERIYPVYANGPGYILSEDIVHFIVEQSEGGTLRVRLPFLCFGYYMWLVTAFKLQIGHVYTRNSLLI